ncbi:hypothetical protein [Amycolatopsis sp. NPDC021455]|uniref:effector-associated domain 2-containing protein n=1 Tax=Amycolatopsis sp. NPDC021455 TaxID=3154901 RepID=UPI0033FF2F1C
MDSAACRKTFMALGFAGHDDTGPPARRLFDHRGLWEQLRASFEEAGVSWDVLSAEDTGEGSLIQLPAQVVTTDLVRWLPDFLLAWVRRFNVSSAGDVHVQLRVAFHTGEARQDNDCTAGAATSHAFSLVEAPETKRALERSGAALALIASDSFYRDLVRADSAAAPSYRRMRVSVDETKTGAWLRLLGAVDTTFPGRKSLSSVPGPALPDLVEALLAVSCVRGAEGRRLLLDLFPRRDIADIIPHHTEDRLHVIALAMTCRRFDRGLVDLLDAIRLLEPESPQVTALAALIEGG